MSAPKVKEYVQPVPPKLPNKLLFSPYAWSKLRFIRDLGDTEVGFFGVTAPDNPLFVEDVMMVKQECTSVTVEFDDDAVSDYVEDMAVAGYQLDQFFRIWIHTHPGNSPDPSGTDEETFKTCFGLPAWAVMFIVARGDQTYGRMKFNAGPGCNILLPSAVTLDCSYPGVNYDAWIKEYEENVQIVSTSYRSTSKIWTPTTSSTSGNTDVDDEWSYYDSHYNDLAKPRINDTVPPWMRLPSAYQEKPSTTALADQDDDDSANDLDIDVKSFREQSEEEDALDLKSDESRQKNEVYASTCPQDVGLDVWRVIMHRVAGQTTEEWAQRGDRMLELNTIRSHEMTPDQFEEMQLLELEERASEIVQDMLIASSYKKTGTELLDDLEQEGGEMSEYGVGTAAEEYLNSRHVDDMSEEDWDEYERLLSQEEVDDEHALEAEIETWEKERASLEDKDLQVVTEGAADGGWANP